MKKIYLVLVLCIGAFLTSCTQEPVAPVVEEGISVEGEYVIPKLNLTDMSVLENDMAYFSKNIMTSNRDGIYTVKVLVDVAEDCPFSKFTYQYFEDGTEGFNFTYTYDESKDLSEAVKAKINEIYNLEENSFPVAGQITNKF